MSYEQWENSVISMFGYRHLCFSVIKRGKKIVEAKVFDQVGLVSQYPPPQPNHHP